MTEDITFIDAEKYNAGKNNELSFRQILLIHLMRITKLASTEFRGGFYEKTEYPMNTGSTVTIVSTEKYVQDSIQVYINAVNCLSDLLSPHYDDAMRSEEGIITQEAQAQNKNPLDDKDARSKQELANARKLFRALNAFLKRESYFNLGGLDD